MSGNPKLQPDDTDRRVPAVDSRETEPADAIVVVGPCASGKTTLVANLVRLGYRARVVAQEHSEIEGLWQRARPKVLIVLSADLPTVRARRGRDWPEAIYRRQQRRLAHATSAATVVLDTGRLSSIATLAAATGVIREAGVAPHRDQ